MEGKFFRGDRRKIIFLTAFSLAIGLYLIATAVMISKDGVYYLKLAEKFGSKPLEVIRGQHPFGVPFFTYCMHKLLSIFINSESMSGWIVSGQTATLILKTLSIIPLYFIGKRIVGRKDVFRAILILLFLPYPAEMGSDVLRDWPHLLFLSSGILVLWKGFEKKKWWLFIVAGVIAGLGHMIRVECAQLVIYGLVWAAILFFLKWQKIEKKKLILWSALLFISFAAVIFPYLYTRGEILPRKAKEFLEITGNYDQPAVLQAGPAEYVNGFGRLLQALSEEMMYYFFPFALLGLYVYLKEKRAKDFRTFIISALLIFYLIILLLLHADYGYISGRHVLPVLTLLVFFVPEGFRAIGSWLNRKKEESEKQKETKKFVIICISVGLAICVPKLVRPINYDKEHYLNAAKWLNKSAPSGAKIAVFDRRIGFYSKRQYHQYEDKIKNLKRFDYLVAFEKDGEVNIEMDTEPVEKFADKDNKKTVLIYKLR